MKIIKVFTALLIITISTLAAYQTVKFCLVKTKKEVILSVKDDKTNYPTLFTSSVSYLEQHRFEDKIMLIFIPMILFSVGWGLVIGLFYYMFNILGAFPDPDTKLTKEEIKRKYIMSGDDFLHLFTWPFVVVGVIIIPLLCALDIDYALWIIS